MQMQIITNNEQSQNNMPVPPLVSILLPVYNAALYLRQAVDSIFSQTYEDFEIIALNDGSTDASLEVLHSYCDPRMRIVNSSTNKGVIWNLNRGLMLARGSYIAQLDSDDIAHPSRLEKQVSFLDSHPEIALVGTWANLIDETGHTFDICQTTVESKEIQVLLFKHNCIIHSSVMFRKECVVKIGGYDPASVYAEDYDLWLRLSELHAIANLPETLVSYRIHGRQISFKKLKAQHTAADAARQAALIRRKGIGMLSKDEKLPEQTAWQRLNGAEATIGRDYLVWASRYKQMGRRNMAIKLSLLALLHSPFSEEARNAVFETLINRFLSHEQLRALRWYRYRIKSFIFGRKTHSKGENK